MDSNLEYLDGLYMTAMQKSEGINNLFDSFFGFLLRKSDFYADAKRSKDFVDENYLKYFNQYKAKAEKEAKKKQKEEAEKKKLDDEAKKKVEPSVKEITAEEFERRKKAEAEGKIDEPVVEKVEETSVEKKEGEKEEDKIAEGKVRPGALNGGSTDEYIWTQPVIHEVGVTIPVDKGLKGKDFLIKYDTKKLFVAIKGKENTPIIDGEFYSAINADTFVWTLEEVKGGKIVTITFEKLDQMKWWDCLIKGHQPIDTTKINPEPSKLSDLDGEMRTTVEKMMYDQRQKAQGLPTSDEQPKFDMMKKFMEKHPEMDFSKANMSGFGGQPMNWGDK
jgi:flagellar biosynthesis GTPase FlhF